MNDDDAAEIQFVRQEQIHEQEMARYRQLKSETVTNRILGVVALICTTLVIFAIIASVRIANDGKRATLDNARIACIEQGATWVGGNANTCVQMTPPQPQIAEATK